ncbi:MAG: hypothetical protein C0620_03145 [Desulfuromonas sp.]|nr:MAG: hypothetical protein C0620_03145 [Desulfuromonas sp.]
MTKTNSSVGLFQRQAIPPHETHDTLLNRQWPVCSVLNFTRKDDFNQGRQEPKLRENARGSGNLRQIIKRGHHLDIDHIT